jgi:hypothetical protein
VDLGARLALELKHLVVAEVVEDRILCGISLPLCLAQQKP